MRHVVHMGPKITKLASQSFKKRKEINHQMHLHSYKALFGLSAKENCIIWISCFRSAF